MLAPVLYVMVAALVSLIGTLWLRAAAADRSVTQARGSR